MGEPVQFDLSTIRAFVDATFPGGAALGIVRFDEDLRVAYFELGLAVQQGAEMSAEYVILGPGNYYRQRRSPERMLPVSVAEQVMLNVCVAMFTELAMQHGELLRLPLPPRFRGDVGSTMSN